MNPGAVSTSGPDATHLAARLAVLRPAARSVSWLPLACVGAVGLLVVALVRGADGPVGSFGLVVAATAVSAAATAAADPAEELLAGLPFPAALRLGLRQAGPTLLALAVGWLALELTDAGRATGGVLALTVATLVLTQLVPRAHVRLAAALPLLWVTLDLLSGPRLDGLDAWREHPWALAASALAVAAVVRAARALAVRRTR